MEQAKRLIGPFYRFSVKTYSGKRYSGYLDMESKENHIVIHGSRHLNSKATKTVRIENVRTIEFSNKKYGGVIYQKRD